MLLLWSVTVSVYTRLKWIFLISGRFRCVLPESHNRFRGKGAVFRLIIHQLIETKHLRRNKLPLCSKHTHIEIIPSIKDKDEVDRMRSAAQTCGAQLRNMAFESVVDETSKWMFHPPQAQRPRCEDKRHSYAHHCVRDPLYLCLTLTKVTYTYPSLRTTNPAQPPHWVGVLSEIIPV